MLTKVLDYAAAMVPEVTDQPALIDLAMERGFNWKRGPFGMIDQLGGPPAPPAVRRPGVVLLADLKARPALASNPSASLWDAGDGVACLEFHTKANAIDDGVLELIEQHGRRRRRALPGAGDLQRGRLLLDRRQPRPPADAGQRGRLGSACTAFGERGQRAFDGLKFAPVPVVGAPTGRALGGGCEVLLHCDAVQAHTETYMGLVELGVGLLPAWGGCRELLIRATETSPGGPMPPAAKAFEVIATASVSASAQNAKELGYLRASDRITPNRDRLLADAKSVRAGAGRRIRAARAAHAHRRRAVWAGDAGADRAPARRHHGGERVRPAAGRRVRLRAHRRRRRSRPSRSPKAPISELELARIATLIRRPQTLERIGHMLTTGKPLQELRPMQTYTAPLADFAFLLEDVFDYPRRGRGAARLRGGHARDRRWR